MCSTPPAICTSSQPAAMLMAESLMAWRLEAQLRLMVTPPVSTAGQPRAADPRVVEALLALLLDAAPADVLDQARIDARPRDDRPHRVRREVFGGGRLRKMPFSAEARPTGVRTASITTACLHGSLLARFVEIEFDELMGPRSARASPIGSAAELRGRGRQRIEAVVGLRRFFRLSVGSKRLPRWEYLPSFSTTAAAPSESAQRRIPP